MMVQLPWPPSALRHNAHQHWRKRHTAAAAYKADCAIALREQGLSKVEAEALHLTMTFCPPDRRRHDMDGMLSRAKWGVDCIADATGIDDYHFGFTLRRGQPVKGGAVIVEVTEA